MHGRRGATVKTGRIARVGMRKAVPAPEAQWQGDLAVVHVAGKNEIECTRREEVEHIRVVTEKDAQGGCLLDELPRLRETEPVRTRVDADDLDTPAAHLDGLGLVDEEAGRPDVRESARPRERIPTELDVVIPEHDERRAQVLQQRPQCGLAARAREQIARHDDQVGLAFASPRDAPLGRTSSARRQAEMKVRQMRDSDAVELCRQPLQGDVERPEPHPARFEPPPPEPGAGDGTGKRGAALQTSSFSSTGATETTCRLNFSSESGSPAATPTSCERWRIGIWKSLPVAALSFDCHASSERWQRGHGVTIVSAPASFACSIGWINSPRAVSSRAWMIGKPQHLTFAG